MSDKKSEQVKVSSKGFLGWIERVANKIPHPGQIFLFLTGLVMVVSFILAKCNVSVVDPTKGEDVAVVNLINSNYIGTFLQNIGNYFASYSPMLTVPICTLGMGVATQSGFLNNGLRSLSSKAKSKWAMSLVLAFIGVNANLVGDIAGYVYPALCGMLYYSIGRNPIAGFILAMSANGVGFGANVVVSAGDANLAGVSKAALDLLGGDYLAYETAPTMGWYFMFASTFILTILLAICDVKIVEPSLDKAGIGRKNDVEVDLSELELSDLEKKGLKNGVYGMLAVVALVVLMCLPGMPFAAPAGGNLLNGKLTKCMVPIIFAFFFVPGLFYGKTVGNVTCFKDVVKMMQEEYKTLAPFYVVSFFACIFVQLFNDSKIAYCIAVKAGGALASSGISGGFLLVMMIIFIMIINIFMTSASTKWNLLAPVFVPMLAMANITPAAVQIAYRMGDGMTNSITPISAALIVNLAYAQKYDPDVQLGTIIVGNMKHTFTVGLIWIAIFYLWIQAGIAVGPGYSPFFA